MFYYAAGEQEQNRRLPRVASWITSGTRPIPVGEHIVELRHEPWTLQVGRKISPVGYAAFIVLAVAARARHWRKIVGGKEPTTFRGGGQ